MGRLNKNKSPKKKRVSVRPRKSPLSMPSRSIASTAREIKNGHDYQNSVKTMPNKSRLMEELPCTSKMAVLNAAKARKNIRIKKKRLAMQKLGRKNKQRSSNHVNPVTLTPKVGRRVLGLKEDDLNFKKFRNSLNSRNLNSTALSVSGTKPKHHIADQLRNAISEKTTYNSIEALIIRRNSLLNKLADLSKDRTENTMNKPADISLEDGELPTMNDNDNDTVVNENDDDDNDDDDKDKDEDDDCVFIEQKVEEIIIDDTENPPIYYEDITGDIADNTLIDLTPKSIRKSIKKANKSKQNSLDDEIIVLDDTVDVVMQEKPKTIFKKETTMNESVVFVSETFPDFIPLVSNNVPNRIKVLPDETAPVHMNSTKSHNSLFSASEKRELRAYNENTYNPNSTEERIERKQNPKRLVIIDGSNVAFSHSRKECFSVKGIQICVEHFKRMGHEVKAVIPLFRTHKTKSTDPAALEKMHKEGIIVLTPCKNLPGHSSSCYDDRFILQLASELDAAIVSNDNYRDLINENSAFKKLIENRVTGYTWCDDVFILPKDPYGKFGPTLHSILNREV